MYEGIIGCQGDGNEKGKLSAVLKVDSDEADLICSGIEFHGLGAANNGYGHTFSLVF